MTEIELKFRVDPKRAAALDDALRAQPGALRSIRSRYFDTADRRLARARLSLRLRKTDGSWEQTLKAPGPHFSAREEETVSRPGKWGSAGPDIDPTLHAGTRAGQLLGAALHGTGADNTELLPVHETEIKRRVVEVEADGACIELAFDRGTIRAGLDSTPVCELELELKSGPPAPWIALAKAGIAEYGLSLSTVSKAARADRLAQGLQVGPPVKSVTPNLSAKQDGAALYSAIVEACLEQVIGNASEIAGGGCDAEHIHQLRVGIRRLRSAARELGRLAPAYDAAAWEPPLSDAFRALGAYRDRETVAPAIEARLQAAGSPSPSIAARASAPPDPLEVVGASAFQTALLDVMALTATVPSDGESTPGPAAARRVINKRLARLQRQLEQGARRFGTLDEDGQHRVRKRLKRLRYLVELVAPLYGKRKVEAYRARLEPAQDAVGEHVDLLLSRRAARRHAEGDEPRAWFNVGWLGAEIARSTRRARKALQRAGRAPAFW